MHAEEATEIPPIVPIYLDTELVTDLNKQTSINRLSKNDGERNDRRMIFKKIGEQDFEDVVFTPEKRSKKTEGKAANGKTENSGETEMSSLMALAQSRMNDIKEKTTYASLLTLSIDDECILKAERNLESIQKDVENKEKLLADVLNFDLSEFMTNSQVYSSNAGANNSLNSITYLNCKVPTNDVTTVTNEKTDETEIEEEDRSVATETESADEDESYRTELKKLEELGECSKQLLQRKASSEIGARTNNNRSVNAIHPRSKGIDCQELERHFNNLSKEFVTSANSVTTVGYEEIEDWVVVPSVP